MRRRHTALADDAGAFDLVPRGHGNQVLIFQRLVLLIDTGFFDNFSAEAQLIGQRRLTRFPSRNTAALRMGSRVSLSARSVAQNLCDLFYDGR